MRTFAVCFAFLSLLCGGCTTVCSIPVASRPVAYSAPAYVPVVTTAPTQSAYRGQGAVQYRSYQPMNPTAYKQAVGWDNQDLKWAENARRDRAQSQREQDAAVRREISRRRQAENERRATERAWRETSQEARQWYRLLKR